MSARNLPLLIPLTVCCRLRGRAPIHCARLICLCLLALIGGGGLAASQPPQRIVSAAPSVTEMLYALGVGDRVVGVTQFCRYPPEVKHKTQIGSYLRPNLERILEINPDLVVVLTEHGDLRQQLHNIGLAVLDLQHNTLEQIYDSLLRLGQRVGVEGRARSQVSAIQQELEEVRSQTQGLPRRRVMFVVGRTPGTIQDLIVVGRSSFLNELIHIAGGRNVFQDAVSYYPRIPREELYARLPEVVIDMGNMAEPGISEERRAYVTQLWKQLPALPAVQQDRVYPVANDIFMVPGPRVSEAARALLRMIHPEVNP